MHLLLSDLLHKDLHVTNNITSEGIKLKGKKDNFWCQNYTRDFTPIIKAS